MRRTLAAHTATAVLLAFFGAPFLHLHAAESQDDCHDHDGPPARGQAALVHTHLPDGHAARHDDTDISRTEEHELSLNLFAVILKQPVLPDLPFLIAARIGAEPRATSAARIVLHFTRHTHDPPPLDAANPRAPPA